MLARCSIRAKLLISAAMLFSIVAALSFGGITGVMSYRRLVRGVSDRAAELPLAAKLNEGIHGLRDAFAHGRNDRSDASTLDFSVAIDVLEMDLQRYEQQLHLVAENGSEIVDLKEELATVAAVKHYLKRVEQASLDADWMIGDRPFDNLLPELENLTDQTSRLPNHLHARMQDLKGVVRGQYRSLNILTWTTSFLALTLLFVLVKFFYNGIFGPLSVLVDGSRRVASGDFHHRIELQTDDEMSQLAAAMNNMTRRFCEIRDDLDQQVRLRTKEVVRSEQMASVGFLAAGVAHEINNPLASIAWSAESLEARLHDILYVDDDTHNEEVEVLRTYLRRIQDEAFRCKGITEALLDFSRMSDVERHRTDLREIVEDVIEIVKHLGRYRNKAIEFRCQHPVIARVNTQEIKQVVLNLITNALDSLDQNGRVRVGLRTVGENAELLVEDDGCGMTEEVRQHLFEPFFTRRRDGQGTGLGLSITYRIVVDHGGQIESHSEGPGLGSTFRVTLPLVHDEKTKSIQKQVA